MKFVETGSKGEKVGVKFLLRAVEPPTRLVSEDE